MSGPSSPRRSIVENDLELDPKFMQKACTDARQISYLKLLIFINQLFIFLKRQIKRSSKKGKNIPSPVTPFSHESQPGPHNEPARTARLSKTLTIA
jgi:hypothetical protein